MKKISFIMLGFCVVFLLSGCNSTKKEEAEPSRSVSLAPETSSSQISESTVSSASQSSSTTESSSKAQLTDAQKGRMNQAFLDWAGGRAVIGNMAVSYCFFDHGAAGRGDWYANTQMVRCKFRIMACQGKCISYSCYRRMRLLYIKRRERW
ncbi:hypothetical protein ABW365_03400 [Enterococcus avium]